MPTSAWPEDFIYMDNTILFWDADYTQSKISYTQGEAEERTVFGVSKFNILILKLNQRGIVFWYDRKH